MMGYHKEKSEETLEIPRKIQILRDHKGNEMRVGHDLTHEEAMHKLGECFDIHLYTYILQPVRKITKLD